MNTKVEVVCAIGIDQLLQGIEIWLLRCSDDECSKFAADRLASFSRQMMDKYAESRKIDERKDKARKTKSKA